MKESLYRVDADFLRLWSSDGQSLTKPVNSRIRTAKYNNKKSKIKLNIIQCYAPINDTDDKKKDTFNQQLQAVLNKAGKKDMTILMGNFNQRFELMILTMLRSLAHKDWAVWKRMARDFQTYAPLTIL